jgi:hypothetical protein
MSVGAFLGWFLVLPTIIVLFSVGFGEVIKRERKRNERE